MEKGTLYLIPCSIAENTTWDVLPRKVGTVIQSCKYFLAENVRTSRRFISSLELGVAIEELNFEELNKDTPPEHMEKLAQPLLKGHDMGILSESGIPGVADPGAKMVEYAHKKNIKVVPLSGPSSLILALAASGLNGQKFAFKGYLPIEKDQREKAIKTLEKISSQHKETQLFIETPYRNNQLLESLLATCRDETLLCVAKDVTGDQEDIRTLTIRQWKKQTIDLHKIPTVFLLQG